MSEQGDWDMIEEEISEDMSSPAQENKGTAPSSLSDESEANLQFMEASLTQSFFQKNDAPQPEPAAEINLPKEAVIAAPTALKEEITVMRYPVSSTLSPCAPKKKKQENISKSKRNVARRLNAGTWFDYLRLFAAVFAYAYLVVSKTMLSKQVAVKPDSNGHHHISTTTQVSTTQPRMLSAYGSALPVCLNNAFPSLEYTNEADPWSNGVLSDGRFTDSSKFQKEDIKARIGRLENEVSLAHQRLTGHDNRLASMESQITELTKMIIKLSSSGAYFYTNDPRSSSEIAVEGPQENLFVEAKTEICQQQGSSSQDVMEASQNTEEALILMDGLPADVSCTGARGAEEEGEDAATSSSVLSETENDVGSDESGAKNSKLHELQDRVTALEHAMDALQSLLSTSRDKPDGKSSLVLPRKKKKTLFEKGSLVR